MKGRVPSILRFGLAFYFLWTGILAFFSPERQAMLDWVKDHALLSGSGVGVADALSYLDGALRLSAAALLLGGRAAWAAVPMSLCGVATLSLLFTNPVWMDDLGGFPAIGSGQGVIKALCLVGLALWCWGRETENPQIERRGAVLSLFGVVWVLVWIGAMKFTLPEAQGIEGLVKSHPLMSWMYSVWDLMGVSRVIGVTELVTAALLLCWFFEFRLFSLGALLTVGTFVTTLSFLFTLPGWHKELGFPVLSGSGGFLLADLPMLLTVLLLWLEDPRRSRS